MARREVLLAVPNISEGRDQALINHIAGNVALLDVHSDPDHNRSVLTYGGEPAAVVDATFAMVERCVASLDITTHDGLHPRFGVVDVLPLVPYRCEEDVARDAANELRTRIEALGLPVYTYERMDEQRRSLPDLRRWLRTTRHETHPTGGVVCLGIRDPLIAFNVNVRGDLDAVRSLLPQLRALPGVRALVFELSSRGLVQVSMNLTESARTGPARVVEEVSARGLDIADVEVVGLIPDDLLPELGNLPLRGNARGIDQALGAG